MLRIDEDCLELTRIAQDRPGLIGIDLDCSGMTYLDCSRWTLIDWDRTGLLWIGRIAKDRPGLLVIDRD